MTQEYDFIAFILFLCYSLGRRKRNMGKVIFLNKQAETWHKKNDIKIQNPPTLKLVVSKPVIEKPRRSKKPKRETMGQRIFRSLQERDNGEDGNDAG